MSIKIDEQNRTVTLSVSDLCSEAVCSGSLNLIPLRDLRGELGREVHQEYQSRQAQTFPEYRTEVPLRYELAIDEFQVVIQGRLDGVYRDHGTWIIEEIKSTLRRVDPGDESLVVPSHLLQLKMYVHLWMKIHGADEVRGRLVVISCSDRRSHSREVEAVSMDEFMEAQIRKILEDLKRRAKRENGARTVPPLPFPFPRMRRHQERLVEAIQSALESRQPLLVSAPTGIGKTVAALFAALSYSRRQGLTVFFLTSKTTQQRIVAETLKLWDDVPEPASGFQRPFTGLVLRSKEKICANDVVCCHGSRCVYARDFYGKLESNNLRVRLAADYSLITPDLVYQRAVENEVCPFELSVELLPEADLVLCDYNYLYDPRITLKRRFAADSRSSVVIIDEAHNLYSRARDYYSPRLDLGRIQGLRRKIRRMLKESAPSQADDERGPAGWPPDRDATTSFTQELENCLRGLEAYFEAIRSDYQESSEVDQFCILLDREFFDDLRDKFDHLLRRYLLDQKRRVTAREEDEFLDMARSVEEFCSVLELQGDEFVHLFDGSEKADQLRILCRNPGLQLQKRHRAFHSVIAMSATLSPLEFHRDVLGFDRDARLLSLPSPFPPENRKVVVIPEVSTLYRQRLNSAPRIAGIIDQIVAVHPGNYLVFFPSFEFLNVVSPHLNPSGYRLLVQERTMGDHSRNALLEELSDGDHPHLLLGVQGGVFAEGVDYPGNLAIGVIIVGPGLPKIGGELDLTRRYFEEQYGRGFEYACLFPGMNRVVQSAGRVIRSETDRGVIVLIGQRFGYENYMNLFPKDWYESSPAELVSKAYLDDLASFWNDCTRPSGA